MLNWLLYTMLVGGLLTLAAHCVGRVCQLAARPTRWVWISALTLTVVLAGVAPYRAAVLSSATRSTSRVAPLTDSEVRQQVMPSTDRWSESVQFVRREMTTPTITLPAQRVPVSLDAYLAATWGTLSVLVLLFFSTVYLRFRRVRRGWPISDLQGVRVRIAPDGGPVIIGLRRPEIVVPQWLLCCSAEEQRLVLTHEQEHIRAGDPWIHWRWRASWPRCSPGTPWCGGWCRGYGSRSNWIATRGCSDRESRHKPMARSSSTWPAGARAFPCAR